MTDSSAKKWRQFYLLVLFVLLLEIIAFYLITEYYR